MIFEIASFIVSIFVLAWLSGHLMKSLVSMARYLHLREFIVAFFVMAFAGSLPNLFVDLNAALHGMPELAFGDIMGGNLVDLTLVMALAILLSKKPIESDSKMVQKSALFTCAIAVLPMLLIMDGGLNRADGLVLIGSFFIYGFWLFAKGDRFKKNYSGRPQKPIAGFWEFFKNIFKMMVLLGLLLATSQIVINSAQFFSIQLGVSLSLVGVLIVGLANCFPETYFSAVSAIKGEGYMVLGDLMGSVVVCASLVLGIVALVAPFTITNFSPFLIARAFSILAIVFFLFVVRSDKKLTKKEGILLLFIYIAFLLTEIFLPR
jgi:cation:H+ antiporter